MTETDWLTCTTRPASMHGRVVRKASQRKLRLLYAAACRLVLDHAPDPRARAMVEVLERHADGQADDDEYATVQERWRAILLENVTRSMTPGEPVRFFDPMGATHSAITAAGSDVAWAGPAAIQWVVAATGWAA